MYEKFYGFSEKPFSVTPDTKYFFPSEKHKEALDSLLYAIRERKGFAVITGEIGSGKTTVWHTLLHHLGAETKIALITNPRLTPKQMIMAILDDLEVSFREQWSKVRLLSELNRYLLEQASLGFNVVLVIDEAQNLNVTALEEVRLLSNLETEKEKLLQIILMGQPELRQVLSLQALKQLRQRIVVYYHIFALEKDEAKCYIQHRLKISGGNGSVIFQDSAFDSIYFFSGGIPRKINTVCDRALLTGFIRGEKGIDSDIIDEVAKEIDEIVINQFGVSAQDDLPVRPVTRQRRVEKPKVESDRQYMIAKGNPDDLDDPIEYIKGYPEGLLNNGGS